MQSPTLNTQMKKSLRGVAHHLDPIIAVSERGISDGIVEETERALSDHELIKVKVFSADRSSRGEVASALAEATSSIVLQQICLLYTSPSPRDQRGARMPSSA